MKCAVVMGPPRSGTSMIAGVLHNLGVDMGNTFIAPDQNNRYGYFENSKFVWMNEEILFAAGGSWADPPKPKRIFDAGQHLRYEIKETVKTCKNDVWGFKDPRTTLTLPCYLEWIDNPLPIIASRKAIDVILSIMRTFGFNEKQARNIYDEYTVRAINNVSENRLSCKIVLFNEMISYPKRVVDLLCEYLSIEPSKEQIRAAKKHIRQD